MVISVNLEIKTKVFCNQDIRPPPSLLVRILRTGGRTASGKITAYHRGGGSKKFYRIVSDNPSLFGLTPFYVVRIERDPSRSVPVLLIAYQNGYLCYVLQTFGVKIGDVLGYSNQFFSSVVGFSSFIKLIPIGSPINNLHFNYSGIGVRTSGSSARILKQFGPYSVYSNKTLIKLPSGELRLFFGNSIATFGSLANFQNRFKILKKAGQSRWRGKRPTVRGVAMNPVDHPHGGGQGKTSGGRPSVTPWGIVTKGGRTRSVRKPDTYIFVRRSSKSKN